MSSFDLLPDDCIIEILLKITKHIDYMAFLCTCTRMFQLSHKLPEIRKIRDCYIADYVKMFEGPNGRSLLAIKGDQAASLYFGSKYPNEVKFKKSRFITHLNLYKLKYLCKTAGNIVVFRRKKDDNGFYPANDIYIKFVICWVTGLIQEMEIHDGKRCYSFDREDWHDCDVNLSEFYTLYKEFYEGTPFEKFPGKLLLKLLTQVGGRPKS